MLLHDVTHQGGLRHGRVVAVLAAKCLHIAMLDVDVPSQNRMGPRLELTLDAIVKVALVLRVHMIFQITNTVAIKIAKGTEKTLGFSVKRIDVNS